MTPADLEAIEARAKAATEGPWLHFPDDSKSVVVQAGDGLSDGLAYDMREDDSEFIAAARADVPALVAEIRNLRALLNRLASGPPGAPRPPDGYDGQGGGWCGLCGGHLPMHGPGCEVAAALAP